MRWWAKGKTFHLTSSSSLNNLKKLTLTYPKTLYFTLYLSIELLLIDKQIPHVVYISVYEELLVIHVNQFLYHMSIEHIKQNVSNLTSLLAVVIIESVKVIHSLGKSVTPLPMNINSPLSSSSCVQIVVVYLASRWSLFMQ